MLSRVSLSCLAVFCLSALCKSQQFVPNENQLGVEFAASGVFGSGVSVYDWDKDGLDDITLLSMENSPKFYHNTGNGFVQSIFQGVPSDLYSLTHLTWVDFDNDGDSDISVNSRLGEYWLYKNNGNFDFTEVSDLMNIASDDSLHGHCWGDYDRDGDLDLYLSVYNSFHWARPNYLYRNDGGFFTDVTEELQVGNGTQNTFQTTFSDINHDLWPDLILINDRWQNYNELYKNLEGTFTPIAAEANFDYDLDSMTNTVGDYDNDGDLDVFITSTPVDGNHLFVNDGSGNFTEVGNELGLRVYDWCWSGQWIDIDNDGMLDLLVVSQPIFQNPNSNLIFHQTSPGVFEQMTNSGVEPNPGHTFCSGIGDFNNDGALDILMHSYAPKGTEIYLNEAPSGNYIRIQPEGTASNRDGIGTWIHVHAGNIHRHHFTQCGEAYMGQNSNWIHFGLGEETIIDSLIMEWPSGHVDKAYDFPVNQQVLLPEGFTILPDEVQEPILSCGSEEVILSAPPGFGDYLWSTGETSAEISVGQPGTYWYTVTNEWGVTDTSVPIEVQLLPEPSVEVVATDLSCYNSNDGSIVLNTQEPLLSVNWLQPISGTNPQNLSAGLYNYALIFANGCETAGSVWIENQEELQVDVNAEHCSCFNSNNGSIELDSPNSEISTVTWNNGSFGNALNNLTPGWYSYNLLDVNGCASSGNILIEAPAEPQVEIMAEAPACFGESNGSIQLEIESEQAVLSISWQNGSDGNAITGLPSGLYEYQVVTEPNCLITGTVELIQPDILLLEPVFALSSTQGCEGSWSGQVAISGGTPPFAYGWNFFEGAELTGSLGQVPVWDCVSGGDELSVQLVVVDANGCSGSLSYPLGVNNVANGISESVLIYPNPADQEITISTPGRAVLRMFDARGCEVNSGLMVQGKTELSLRDFSAGIYLVIVYSENGIWRSKVIIER